MVQQIQHRFHRHPLGLVEEQSNQKEKPYCYGCGEVISASSFSCLGCNYHLHRECALAPSTINHHPLHSHHSGFFLRERPSSYHSGYVCALCKKKRDMFFYECNRCWFALDIKCSFLLNKVGESIFESKDDDHVLLENHKDELKKLDCSWCHRSLLDSICFSIRTKRYFHKKCFIQLPTKTVHPFHRLNTLLLQCDASHFICKLCQKEDHDNYFYRCFACKFDIHLECINYWQRPVIEDEKYHEHPFTLFLKDSFICDACGTNGKFVSYICSTCHLQVHKDCTSLPRIIKVTRHDHALVHKYGAHEKHDCGICFDEVKTEHGSYHCLREDCDFIVHVNCATEDENLYYIVDEDEEKLHETNSSSITRVIEVNEHGEAIKIQNFNHEHNMVLEDKIKEDNADRHCDGCMLSISTSTPSYYCSENCNFFLHKSCAELPKIKHHWFHRFVATLKSKDLEICYLCNRVCSGLFYESIKEHEFLLFCMRCAMVPNVIKCEGHKHFLFYDYKCKGQCNGCGVDHRIGAFRCKECNFSLDFACMTLPPAVRHKCDAHLLKLSHRDHDDTEEHVCDVCEGERDPNRWYYYCPICDNSVHPKCVLGELPFVKNGVTFTPDYTDHQHDVSLVRKVDGYHYCVDCGHLCQDEEALKCRICNFIIHLKCSILLKRQMEHGKAIKIKHFNHRHNLMLEDKIKEDSTDRYCDGCMLSISTSTPFYYCSQCNFFIHKSCAELPKINRHWFHRFVATLLYKDYQICDLCYRISSGLFYRSTGETRTFHFCLRCFVVPSVIKCEMHQHFLFYDHNCKSRCKACGVRHRMGAFRCRKCKFGLDFACLTLPLAIRHKCDNHLLKLSYHDDENDHTEEHVCVVCEEERDPNHWYYYCRICDNSVHPKCALGELPFVKDGTTFTPDYTGHQHNLSFIRKVDGYHYCVHCRHLCQDEEALKCWTCNFIIHLKCSILLKRLPEADLNVGCPIM
ncbi:hypothetical protein PTKIN_Ptkin13bG0203800 [Pterospermum kingtungense]